MSSLSVSIASAVCLALALSGCEKSSKAESKPTPSATATATTPAPAASSAAPAAKPEEPTSERPKPLDTKLTATRREKIDKAYPQARGFVALEEIEGKLEKEKLSSKPAAIHAFDGMAKGKWVLFTGPLDNASAQGFRLGVKYTPRMKGDRLGLSQQFFMVALSDIKGYDPATLKNGTEVVVLVKYQGKGKAGPGYELVAEQNW
jgi:hypothetical protein